MKDDYKNIIYISGIIGFMLLYQLGGIPLLDPDEPVYAQTAREMLASNDYISPQIYGEFWYDKPPLYYWVTAFSLSCLGNTEFAARLPSAVFAVLTAILVYAAGRKMLSARAGLFAALILGTSIEFFYLGKAAVTDATLTFFFSLTLFMYIADRYKLMYIAMAFAVLTKGPVAFVLPMIIICLHCIMRKRYDALKISRVFTGLIIIAVIAGPWYGFMYYLHGMDFLQTFIGYHNITRFLQPEHAAGTKLYYYLPVLIIGFFPWIIYLLQAIKAGICNFKKENNPLISLLIIWSGCVFLFFSISQTKLVSYILPMYPAIALLTGWYLEQIFLVGEWHKLKTAMIIMVISNFVIICELAFVAKTYLGFVSPAIWVLNINLLIMIGLAFYAHQYKNIRCYMGSIIGGMILFMMILMQGIFPIVAEFTSTKCQAMAFQQVSADKSLPIYIDKFYRPGFCYYSGVAGVELDDSFEKILANGQPAYFLVKKSRYSNLTKAKQQGIIILNEERENLLLYKKS